MTLSKEEYTELFYRRLNAVIGSPIMKLGEECDSIIDSGDKTNIEEMINNVDSHINDQNSCHVNMQLNYYLANLNAALRKLTKNDELERYYEKEIYSLRKVVDIYEGYFSQLEDHEKNQDEIFVANTIITSVYTNLGNAMIVVGRYIPAIKYYRKALMLENASAMATMNLSGALFQYGFFQSKPYESDYFYHAAYQSYLATVAHKINLERENYLPDFEERYINKLNTSYIEDVLKKPLSLPEFEMTKENEVKYRHYIASLQLFLEPCSDIHYAEPCFLVDSLTLPLEPLKDNFNDEFIGLFNLMKQEFISARYLWYVTTTNADEFKYGEFADEQTDMVELGDYGVYGIRESILRSAFRMAYSVFDKIGGFINHYFEVGLSGSNVSFKKVWKSEVLVKGKNLIKKPLDLNSNMMLKSIFWSQKDLYEENSINLTDPSSMKLFHMRNNMEHNFLRSVLKDYDKPAVLTKFTDPYLIGDYTKRLLELARECLIYLSLAVHITTKKK